MASKLDPADFKSLKAHVISIFPGELAPKAVSSQQQEEEIRLLARTIGSERFFFVVDLTTFEITVSDGIQRWLGYYEKDFTLQKYWKLVHPGMQKPVHTIFLQLCEVLCKGQFELKFMVQRYSSLIALKHAAGHYVLAKRTASVFQYDEQNRLTEYLNEFTIVGKYNGEALTPSFFTDKGEAEKERGSVVMQKAIEQFLGMKVFSVSELNVARLLAYNPGITLGEIAKILHKSPHTIDTYYKRFLRKSRDFFCMDFPSVGDAARFLRNTGLL
jgi:hypothetical protein